MFLDDIPTFSRLVEVTYWLARAEEGLGMLKPSSRHYRDYIEARDLAVADKTVKDAEKRLSKLNLD